MATSSEAEAQECQFHIIDLPLITVTKILNYLTWEEKLTAVSAIPSWKQCLQTVTAWETVIYGNESEENIYFLNDKRKKFLLCIKLYGRCFKSLRMNFWYKIGHIGLKIIQAISEFCSNLKAFYFTQETPESTDYECLWRKSIVTTLTSILCKVKCLETIGLNQPIIDWTDPNENNLIINLIEKKMAHKVTQLELTSWSFLEHEGPLESLTEFTGLKSLTIRREKVNDDILLKLVHCNLQELVLFQEEEITYNQQQDLKSEFWKQVMLKRPSFQVDMILRYIMVIKDNFPKIMPLRCLVLDDLVNIVTKGVLDNIVDNYQDTLQQFTYTNSLLDNFETGDRRLPVSLVMMAQKCEKLRVLEYGFPLSSSSIFFIARARKLKKFVIPLIEVSYEYDWAPEDLSPEDINLVKSAGSCKASLESAVSELLGFKWRLQHERLTLDDCIHSALYAPRSQSDLMVNL